jgi:cytochrome c-type biogenesis protein CcmH
VRAALLLVLLLFAAVPAQAYDPGAELPKAADEARARDLFRELRCMVCQNQSIDDSDAPLARDLRSLVRERVAAGESNAAIKEFLVARYGDFVLLKPPVEPGTILLWAAPALVLLGGAVAVAMSARRRRGASDAGDLTADERRKLEALASDDT